MAKTAFEPKQSRSEESLQRLLTAAIEVLTERGLEGATIPYIAAKAGLSPGTVYRRFPDKDALLQVTILKFLEEADEKTCAALTPALAEKYSLRVFVESFIKQTLIVQREKINLIRALNQFVLCHPSEEFRTKVDEINTHTIRYVSDFLLLKRDEIKHPEPEVAVPFAILLIGIAIREIILLDSASQQLTTLFPKNDTQLLQELTAAFLKYIEAN